MHKDVLSNLSWQPEILGDCCTFSPHHSEKWIKAAILKAVHFFAVIPMPHGCKTAGWPGTGDCKRRWSLALLEVLMQLTGNECYALTSLGESLFSEQ